VDSARSTVLPCAIALQDRCPPRIGMWESVAKRSVNTTKLVLIMLSALLSYHHAFFEQGIMLSLSKEAFMIFIIIACIGLEICNLLRRLEYWPGPTVCFMT